MMEKALVFDIGGTNIKYGMIDQNAQLCFAEEMPSNVQQGGRELIRSIIKKAKEYTGFSRIGISTAGQVDAKNGRIVYASENIPQYTGTPIRAMFQEEFDLPVAVINDVNAAMLAEVRSGAGHGMHQVIGLTYGTGIGGALVIDGKVYVGSTGGAGEFGHMPLYANSSELCSCGQYGCYEHYASASALLRKVSAKVGRNVTGRDLFDPAQGLLDPCMPILLHWTDDIARGLGGLTHALNPDCIILGGGIMQQSLVYELVRKAYPKFVMPSYAHTPLKQAVLGNLAGMFGAFWAVNEL